jgi:hypothetical protein
MMFTALGLPADGPVVGRASFCLCAVCAVPGMLLFVLGCSIPRRAARWVTVRVAIEIGLGGFAPTR